MKKIFFLILGITLSIAVVMNKEAASQDKKAPKIRIGEFTGSSDETVDETESNSPKGLTDSDVEFMYRAGLFDEEPGFFRQRFSIAFNVSQIDGKGQAYLANEGRTLVRKEMGSSYANGVAIQYHLGTSFIRDFDWHGNPLLGLNLLLDGSFVYRHFSVTSFGVGAELHFLWILKAAVGVGSVWSSDEIFASGEYDYLGTEFLPLKDRKNASFRFFQYGISIPVSNKYDVFALMNISKENRSGGEGGEYSSVEIASFRAGVAWKF